MLAGMETRPLRELLAGRTEYDKRIGGVLREARLSADLSQSELSAMTGVAKTYISNVECGLKKPRPDTVARFLNAIEGKGVNDDSFNAEGRAHQDAQKAPRLAP